MLFAMLLQMPLVFHDPPSVTNVGCAPALSAEPPIPPASRTFEPQAPYGNVLGDSWEMEESACWRGIWTRRGRSNVWDAYWIHPRGERARAVLTIRNSGRQVTVVRTHRGGQSCRYVGKISRDWWEISGTYRCNWEPQTVMPWWAQIIRLQRSEPQLLRHQHSTHKMPPLKAL